MGQCKARKPKQERRNDKGVSQLGVLAHWYDSFDPDLLWATLFAAAASPSARHRATSVGLALAAALRAAPGPEPKVPELLPPVQDLVDHAAKAVGVGILQEDYVAADPTQIAVVRVGDELLRFLPGLTERPIADLSRALRLAEALDDRLVRRRQFGIFNLVRVTLRYVDFCVQALSSSWQPAPDVQLGDAIELPKAELAAARAFIAIDPVEALELDDADLRALEWMTSPASSAKFDRDSPTSPFGRALRYRGSSSEQPDRWLPPTFVPEILAHAITELVESLERDKHARKALRDSCLEEARRALWRFSDALIESPPASPDVEPLTGNRIQWLVPVNQSTFLAVSMILTTDMPRSGPSSIACVQLAEQIRNQNAPVVARMAGGGQVRLRPDAEIVPLVVIAGTGHCSVLQTSGQATLALEDLTWIAETATEDDDLFRFARDLSAPDFPHTFGWEAINYWEPWRTNGKSFFKGGIVPASIFFEPHAGQAEWDRAVNLSDLEVALHGVGLPALRHTQRAEMTEDHSASVAVLREQGEYNPRTGVHHAPACVGWSLALTTPPIAIVRSDPDWETEEEHRFLFDVAGGLVFGFGSIKESWERAHQCLDVPGYRLNLAIVEDVDDEQTSPVVSVPPSSTPVASAPCVISWNFRIERFVQIADRNALAPNELTAIPLRKLLEAGGVEGSMAEEIAEEWSTDRPFLIFETKRSLTSLHHLPSPWRLDPSDESAATASFARRLHAANVQPGEYRGRHANDLVKEHLAPAALKELVERISAHDPQAVIFTGMEQLNRVSDDIMRQQEDLSRVATHLLTEWDPVERMAELAAETLRLRQCNEIIVEAALRGAQGSGSRQPITIQHWSALLAAADAYRTVTTLSERLHHRVAPAVIDISTAYELTFVNDEAPDTDAWVLNGDALNLAAADIRLGRSNDSTSPGLASPPDDVDDALLEAYGATSLDLFLVLTALIQWDSFEEERSVAFVPDEEVRKWVGQAAGDTYTKRRERLYQAIQMLTSTPEQLSSGDWAPWQTRTRRHRLLVQPLVRYRDAGLLISPQYLLTTLSVYATYLAQGILPWTGDVPNRLEKALADRRKGRNLDFERTLQHELEQRGFHTIARIKPGDHSRLGVPAVTTEIDLVCGRPGEPDIWLIEAKDPAAVHGFAETARQMRAFFRDSESKGRLKPCYATQLARKEAELKPYVEAVADALGIGQASDSRPHILRTLFVTRNLTPAGFVAERYEVRAASDFLALVGAESANVQSANVGRK